MIDQMFESFRKSSESMMQMQQEMYRQWTRQWQALPMNMSEVSTEWLKTYQTRWMEFTLEALEKHRESLDSMYKAGLRMLENGMKLSEAKTPADMRRMVEEQGRKNYEIFKEISETQMREFQQGIEKWFSLFPKAVA